MKRFLKREYWPVLLAILAIVVFVFGAISERQDINNWKAISKFFNITDQIKSIAINNHINDEEFKYDDQLRIQELIRPYRYTNRIASFKEVKKQDMKLLYSITAYLSDEWAEEMRVYYSEKEIYLRDRKISFIYNDKNCILVFRKHVCYIDVITK